RLEGEYTTAEQHYEESLALFREIDPQIVDVPAVLHNLGHVALVRGDYTRARRLFEESLTLQHSLGNKAGMAESLAGLAGVLAHGPGETTEEGRSVLQAARLFGASDALRAAINAPMWPAERADYERNLAAARARLDEATWQAGWAEGRAMPLEEAVAYALQMGDPAG
ncbi:MAG TPA: tetratricopeptide repeat protein, partial [Herpetosiphonaceae bacterium]|nr:tetratricopeptide repeat protein [Herpetosiphonaceae bacterium]